MAKEEPIEFEGRVSELLPNSTFLVKLDNGAEVIATYASGKMRKHRIRHSGGRPRHRGNVPYDLSKARVSFRHKDTNPRPTPAPAAKAAHGAGLATPLTVRATRPVYYAGLNRHPQDLAPMATPLHIDQLTVRFGAAEVVRQVSLDIHPGKNSPRGRIRLGQDDGDGANRAAAEPRN